MNWKKAILLFLSILIVPALVFAGDAPDNADVVEYYALEESSSPYTSEVSSADLTGGNIPARTTGIIDYGQNFDGSNDCIGDNIVDIMSISNKITLNGWVKSTLADANPDTIVYRGTWGNAGALGFRQDPNVGFTGGIAWENYAMSPNEVRGVTTTILTDGDWHMVTVVSGDGQRAIYFDGVLDNSNTYTGTIPTYNSAGIFSVGCRNKADRFFPGTVDEVAVFDVALTQANITWLYNTGSPTSDQQYPFVSGISPTITNITNQVMLEDTVTEFPNLFMINDSDGNISDLAVTYVSANTSLISNTGGVTFAIDTTTGQVNATFTPVANAFGIGNITITVTDLTPLGASESFTMTVTNVNDAPTISTINDLNTFSSSTEIIPFTVLDIDNPYTDLTYSATQNTSAYTTSFSSSNGTNQNLTLSILNVYGTSDITVEVNDGLLYDNTQFTLNVYCNTSVAPYTNSNTQGAIPTCYRLSDAWDGDTDIFVYNWFDYGNTSSQSRIEIYRTTGGSNELIHSESSSNKNGNFTVNLSAYSNDDFMIRGYITDTTRTWGAGGSEQRIYTRNIDQQLNLPIYFSNSDGIIYSVIIIILFLTMGIASQSATLTLILSIFGLFFATKVALNVPSQFIWTAGVVVAILIWLISKLRID